MIVQCTIIRRVIFEDFFNGSIFIGSAWDIEIFKSMLIDKSE